ncbi:regulatory protein RecX [Candidatus Parcubacteria bacterium]|nr:MAG: regulatory protein RecX [Candidatus Parcubacteria bacterium]
MSYQTDLPVIQNKAHNKALKFLSYRMRSEKELYDFLVKKKFEENIIQKTIQAFKEEGLVDDRKFIKWWIEQRQTFRPKSKFVLKKELMSKGVRRELIEEVIDDSQDDYEVAKNFFGKKKHRFNKYSGKEYFQKASAFLQRRGFGWDIIKRVLHDENI